MKKLLIALLFPCLMCGQIQIGQDIDGEALDDQSGVSTSLSSDGNRLAIGASLNDGNGNDSGHVRVYENQGGIWVQIGQDIDGETAEDNSGRNISLSADGSVIAIGAIENDDNGNDSGHVRVYEYQGNTWVQLGQDIDGEFPDDNSGRGVSLSADGNVLAIGAGSNDGNGSDSGHVRVFENQNGNWQQIGNDIDGEASNDFSGLSISLSTNGSVLAIGATGNGGNGNSAGHVRIFDNQNNNWIQIGNDIDGEASLDASGRSVSLSSTGNIVAIGADRNDGNGTISGHVRIYENQGGNWTQIGEDIDGEATGDLSGASVSLSSNGNVLAIGAPLNGGNGPVSGHTRVYQNIEGSWIQVVTDIDGEAEGDFSGTNVSLSSNGSVLAIGATGNSGTGMSAGHVRVFDLSDVLLVREFNIPEIQIFPNPAKDILEIEIGDLTELREVNIYNNIGQWISSSRKKRINIAHLPTGVYMIHLTTAKGKDFKKLIKL